MATAEDDKNATEDGGNERLGTEPIDGNGRYPFAGLTRYDEDVEVVDLPENVWNQHSSMRFWATEKLGEDPDPSQLPERGLNTLIPDLPRANHAVPAWIHPRTGEVYRTGKHNAVIEPERAENIAWGFGTYTEAIAEMFGYDEDEVAATIEELGLDGAKQELLSTDERASLENTVIGDDALFQIAGEDHSIINPQQPLEELCEELQDRGLADKVFGEVTIDRGGGRATLDIYMDGHNVESPVFDDDREPVVVGMQVQWSFFDDWAFRVCGQGFDWACENHIHRLTDREIVKYAGDVESRVNWRTLFSDVLDSLDEKRDHLARLIESAANDTLDFSELPDDIAEEFEDEDASPWTALYAYLGLPDYLAREAGKRLRTQADDAFEPNWWEIHSAATYAVSHHDRSERTSGGSYEDHARVANRMLFNPGEMEERLIENYEADRLDEQDTTLAEEGGGVAQIRTAFEDVREKKDRYEEWEEELRDMGVEV